MGGSFCESLLTSSGTARQWVHLSFVPEGFQMPKDLSRPMRRAGVEKSASAQGQDGRGTETTHF